MSDRQVSDDRRWGRYDGFTAEEKVQAERPKGVGWFEVKDERDGKLVSYSCPTCGSFGREIEVSASLETVDKELQERCDQLEAAIPEWRQRVEELTRQVVERER